VCAVLEHRLARRLGVGQHRGIDVDDDLVLVSRDAGIGSTVERRFRHERERVRLQLGHRRRFRGNVLNHGVAGRLARPLIQRLPGRVQRPEEHGAHLRRQPSADDDHAVSS
jgi:hypothetical protein